MAGRRGGNACTVSRQPAAVQPRPGSQAQGRAAPVAPASRQAGRAGGAAHSASTGNLPPAACPPQPAPRRAVTPLVLLTIQVLLRQVHRAAHRRTSVRPGGRAAPGAAGPDKVGALPGGLPHAAERRCGTWPPSPAPCAIGGGNGGMSREGVCSRLSGATPPPPRFAILAAALVRRRR